MKTLEGMNYTWLDKKIWNKGDFEGYLFLNGIHNFIYKFTINGKFDLFILICVCANTIIMSLDNIFDDDGQNKLD